MSANIPFSSIPETNPFPPLYYVEFDNSNAGVAGQPVQLDLIIGQTVTAQPEVPVYVPSALWAANQFGAGSQLAIMAAEVYDADSAAQLWALPLADAMSSSAATGTYTFSVSTAIAGTLFLMIAGREVQVGVTAGESATAIATAVAAAINAYTDSNGMFLPVTAASSSGVVTLTARNKGTIGNQLYLGLNFYGSANQESTPGGVTVTVAAMSGGATDPDLAGVAAALGTTAYDFIALPGYTESTQLNEMQALMSFATGRWSYSQQLYGHVWNAYQSVDGNSGSDLLSFGAGRNDPHMTVVGYESGCPNSPFEVSAGYMSAFAAASKAGVSRPEQTLVIPNLIAPQPGSRFLFATQIALLGTGVALMKSHTDWSMAIMMSVTTYQQNVWGQTDRSYLLATTMFQFMYYVRDQKSNLTQKFPRAILAQDNISFGSQGNITEETPSVVTPSVMADELLAEYARMCPGGDLQIVVQDTSNYNPICQINGSNPNRMDILDDPIMVGGLRMIAVVNQFRLIDPPATTIL